jgi:hypothetical protein
VAPVIDLPVPARPVRVNFSWVCGEMFTLKTRLTLMLRNYRKGLPSFILTIREVVSN